MMPISSGEERQLVKQDIPIGTDKARPGAV
jgi:hypothetical protein